MNQEKPILDACCGGRMGWFNKENPLAIFCDNREETAITTDCKKERIFHVKPDILADFRDMPHADKSFALVYFDPPHLERLGKKSYSRIKYGGLLPT